MSARVAYCRTYGGFSLSEKAVRRMAALGHAKASAELVKIKTHKKNGGLELSGFFSEVCRHDPVLIKVIDELGLKVCSGKYCDLAIAKVEGSRYRVEEYDGNESIVEPEDQDWIEVPL